ncbi:MAG: GDP-mannose 4,6-dehydratase [Actinobacteria bacterium]|nr:GDP-mannose 4,6-dehydratase [Actinomycetota bacterium]
MTEQVTSKRALITGIGGQDGSYLAELLLGKGYHVEGVVEGDPDRERPVLTAIRDKLTLHVTDLTDRARVHELISLTRPDEIYNLAAPSFVPASWDDPISTINFMAGSVICMLETIHEHSPHTRFFQASSSEIFRDAHASPQNELTTAKPASPYGVGKLAGHGLVHSYRERYGIHASSGILYNHESPRRPVDFVTRKIVNAAVSISLGELDELALGDLSARRDWGYAPDYVEAMWLMLQQDQPDDFVVATGVLHTVGELVDAAFGLLGLDVAKYVRVDPAFVRQGDEALLVGDPSKAAERLGWRASTTFERLVEIMVKAELESRSQTPTAYSIG